VKLPVSWMREFVAAPEDPAQIAKRLAACGFEVASIDGDVIDFEITANRPDCLSVYGLAREAATAFDLPLAPLADAGAAAAAGPGPMLVSIGDAGCGRYTLAVAEVKVAPSPAWLADRLMAAGLRPINNVVDVTNYVMLETGHPMHAFDVAKLRGPEIRVRRARAGEQLTTLDGQARVLDDTMLVIADRERAVAIAGVMGGASSEVSATTTHVALESAWFLPALVRATSRRLLLKTEASARFERGADAMAPPVALRRALALLAQIGAGKQAGGVADVFPRPVVSRRVPLRRDRIARLLGDTVPDADVVRILARLGFTTSPVPTGWQVDVPSYRVDVSREADLIEEVGRHWGFNRIPPTFPALTAPPRPLAPAVVRDRRVRRLLCGAGLQEAVTFTFVERDLALPFLSENEAPIEIANPLSEKFAVLRPSLLGGLLDALVYSRRRETEDIRLFEVGAAFGAAGESPRIGWVMTGARESHWGLDAGDVTFFDAKGVAELLAEAFGVALSASPADDLTWAVPGRAARLHTDAGDASVLVGVVGQIRPEIVAARGLGPSLAVFGGEIDPRMLSTTGAAHTPSMTALPRFPSVVRDLSLIVDERLPAARVRGTIRSHAPATLVSVREFDRYQGKGIPEGTVSLSVRLTFRDADRTLTDVEVQQAVDGIIAALARDLGAGLRGK